MAAAESQQRTPHDIALSTLVERVVHYAIFTLDAEGRVSSWNPAAERMKGYTSSEILGKHFSMLYLAEDAASGLPDRHLREADANGVFHGEGPRRRKNGEIFVADVEITPLRGSNEGPITGYAKIVRDISDQARDRDRLREANSDLEQFASIAAHDLQEPLRMVSNYLGLLQRRAGGSLDQQAHGYVAHAVDGAKRMQNLIVYLLALARIGRESAPMMPVNMSSAWEEAVDNLGVRIADMGASVTADLLPMVLAHRDHIVQLFQNLLTNALKFQRPDAKPTIHLSSAPKEDETIAFSLCDNGIGMKSEDLKRIFAAFERLHSRGEFAGSGLGLAICMKIVDRHGGRLWVDSELGRGSTFHFTLKKA